VQALHVKDGDGTRDNKKQVAVGQGSIPVWDYINATPNLKYGVVELDDSEGDRFVAIADSFAYLTGKGQ
jgi:predicted small integral membrane protein